MASLRASLDGRLTRALPDPAMPRGTPAAVMVPVIDGPDAALLLTKRTDSVRDHKGEISFPGGVRHIEDPDLLTTALRETEEELGIPVEAFDVVGRLPLTDTVVSGYVIAPYVGLLAESPVLTPSPSEIAEVFELPVRTLVAVEREVPSPGGGELTMHVYEVEGDVVWGATGRILHTFLELLREGGWT